MVIIDKVPLNGSGKLLRRELRDLAEAESGYKMQLDYVRI